MREEHDGPWSTQGWPNVEMQYVGDGNWHMMYEKSDHPLDTVLWKDVAKLVGLWVVVPFVLAWAVALPFYALKYIISLFQ